MMRLWTDIDPLVVVCAGYEPYHGYDLEVTNEQHPERELGGKSTLIVWL